ncbi:thiol peroxidase [candidate division KSB1 bacterium]|nr:thiol peroxidase [candidate division KSB1 bacterium]
MDIERSAAVTFKGKPVTLLGHEAIVGNDAREFTVLANDLKEVHLNDFYGKMLVLNVVVSLDTSTCDIQTRRFNEELRDLSDEIKVITISMDLPFAQKRWCGAAGLPNVETYSDHRDARFGVAFGVLMKELRLLARSVFIIDKTGVIRYAEYVKEGTDQPNYAAAISAVKALL